VPTAEALFDAIDHGDLGLVDEILVADPSLATSDRLGVSPLCAAAYAGHPELAEPLERGGADADVFDTSALGDVDRLRSLLDADESGGLVRAVSGDGFTALHLAAWFGHPKAAELLLARGADPMAVAPNGTELQPLHSAAAAGHRVIAHLLLDRGADIDACQAGAITALHSAAHRNDLDMVSLLLDRGADPASVTADGRRPADLASSPEVLSLLP
jgi:ankyrin repeat protein